MILKRIIAGLTSASMIFTMVSIPVSDFTSELFNTLTVSAESADEFNEILYKADTYVTEEEANYKWLQNYINFDSPSVILAKAANSKPGFMLSVAAWETLTFESYKIPGQYIDKVGYYETIIFKALDSYYKSTIIKDNFNNEYNQTSKKTWSAFTGELKLEGINEADIRRLSRACRDT